MGAWFLATSLGNLIAGAVSGQAVELMAGQFLQLMWMPAGAGLALLLLAKPIMKMSTQGLGCAGPEGGSAENE